MNSILKYLFLSLISLIIATSCEDDCLPILSNADENAPTLMIISPLKERYQAGEEVSFSITVPSKNAFFDRSLDLFEETTDSLAVLSLDPTNIFTANTFNLNLGQQLEETTRFALPYDAATDSYRLEATVQFIKSGSYSLLNGADVDFGLSDCADYSLKIRYTGVQNGPLTFEVTND